MRRTNLASVAVISRVICAMGMAALVLAIGGTPVLAGTYLPAAGALPKAVNVIDPQTTSTHIIQEYVGGLQTYTADVYCPPTGGVKVGTLSFEYAAYLGTRATDPAPPPNTIAGAAIRGGFILNPGLVLCEGHTLRWLQTFTESGADGNGTTTVDGSPFYPNFPINGVAAALYDVPFDLLYKDTPANTDDKEIALLFESALVCIDEDGDVSYLGSFTWGYSIDDGGVSADPPSAFGAVSATWLAAASAHDYFDVDGHTLQEDTECDCFCPEPSSITMLLLGVVAMAGTGFMRLRRRRVQ